MGFVIVLVFSAHLLLSLILVAWAVSHARKRGKSAKKWGWGTALVMYLIPFWDWLPTVATHQYYCATEAGFWGYKTVDEWKAENPGVMETLPKPSLTGSPTESEQFDGGRGRKYIYHLNDRFDWVIIRRDISRFVPVILVEQEVKDVRKDEVLARYVDFATGNSVRKTLGPPGPLKFWLSSQHCSGGELNQDALRKFRDNYYGGEK